MSWLALLKLVLSIADWIAKKSHDKQLLDAGEAMAISGGLKVAHERLEKVIAVGRSVHDNDGVRDPFHED